MSSTSTERTRTSTEVENMVSEVVSVSNSRIARSRPSRVTVDHGQAGAHVTG